MNSNVLFTKICFFFAIFCIFVSCSNHSDNIIEENQIKLNNNQQELQEILETQTLNTNFSISDNDNNKQIDLDLDTSTTGSISNPSDHNKLINRDMKNQHPIEAITSLTEELLSRPNTEIPDSFINTL